MFVGMGPAKVAPHMDKVFPVWFCTFFDSSAEVSKLGRQCFEETFQGIKSNIFRLSYRFFLNFADEHLKQNE